MNEKTLLKLEYDKIIGLLTDHASSEAGKERCRTLVPMTDVTEINIAEEQTAAAFSRIVKKGRLSFSGCYSFGFKIFNDIDLSYDIAQLLYKHGGMLVKRLQKDGTIIVEDSQITPEFLEKMKKDNLTVITVEEFYNKIPR